MNDTGVASMSFEPGAAAPEGSIALCEPRLRGNEWKYIKECLDDNMVSSVGPFVKRFEQIVADYVGTSDAVATVTGTAALHIALLVAGVRPDEEVLVPTLTFIAPANAVRYVGGWPVLIDAEPDYWQIDPEKVIDFLERGCRWSQGKLLNKTTGRLVRAILPVHILGHPVNMDPILEAARTYELVVIEDATESLGAQYKGRKVGNLGDIACFSFNGNKIITTGGGGMIVTNKRDWAEKARYLTTQAKDDAVEYIHNEIGYNYRLTNVQAALGCAQIEQLNEFIAAKRRLAGAYGEGLGRLEGISLMSEASWARSVFWMYTILVDHEGPGEDRRALMGRLAQHRIQARPLWQPLHRSPVHCASQSFQSGIADEINRKALSLPSSTGLTGAQQQAVIDIITSGRR